MSLSRLQARDEHGAVAIIVAILMTTFLILGAFAVDIANAYAQGRQVSVSMDSAALTAAAQVGDAMPPNTACDNNVLAGLKNKAGATVGAQAIAQAAADQINQKNRKDGLPEAVQSVTVACTDSGKTVQVTVGNSRGVPTALAGIIGISSINPGNYAAARWGKYKVAGGLRPWAVCSSTLQAAQNNRGTTYWTALGNWNNAGAGICGTSAPGQWGGVDFNGGSNAAGDLADWTANGYPGAVDIPNPVLPADPGVSNSSALRAAFESLINSVVLFPAVTGISGNGNNAVFNAVGIGTVKVCGVVYNGTIYNTGSTCWTPPTPPTSTSTNTVTTFGPIATTGRIDKNSNVLTIPASPNPWTGVPTGANITNTATITIAGAAGNKNSPQTLTVTDMALPNPLPTTSITLPTNASNDVTAAAVSITIKSTVTTTTTTPGFGLYDKNGNLQDMIEFRYVDYQTSKYNGPGSNNPCVLTDPLCVGQTALWQ